MNTALAIAAGVVGSYLLGAIPFAFLAGKAMGLDIRKVGSGNIGATNLARALGGGTKGTIAFVGTSILDVSKGFVPAFFVARWAAETTGNAEQLVYFQLAFGLAAILGHVFPVYLGFKGGKAVNTSLGVALGLAWLPALVALATWIIIFAIWRYVSLGSIIAAAIFPVALAFVPGPWRGEWVLFGFCVAVSALVIVRHISNIKRLLAGTEKRMGKEVESQK